MVRESMSTRLTSSGISMRSIVALGLATCLLAAGCSGPGPHRPALPPSAPTVGATTTGPVLEVPQVMLVWTPGRLPPGFAARVGGMPGVRHAVPVVSGTVWLARSLDGDGHVVDRPPAGMAIPLDLAAAAPQALAPFLPPATRAWLLGSSVARRSLARPPRGDPWRDLRAAAADRGGWDAGDRRTGSAWRALGKRRRGPSGGSDRRRRPRPRRWRARAAGLAGAGGHPWADDRPLPARPARSRNTVAGAGGTHPRNPAAWRAGADPGTWAGDLAPARGRRPAAGRGEGTAGGVRGQAAAGAGRLDHHRSGLGQPTHRHRRGADSWAGDLQPGDHPAAPWGLGRGRAARAGPPGEPGRLRGLLRGPGDRGRPGAEPRPPRLGLGDRPQRHRQPAGRATAPGSPAGQRLRALGLHLGRPLARPRRHALRATQAAAQPPIVKRGRPDRADNTDVGDHHIEVPVTVGMAAVGDRTIRRPSPLPKEVRSRCHPGRVVAARQGPHLAG